MELLETVTPKTWSKKRRLLILSGGGVGMVLITLLGRGLGLGFHPEGDWVWASWLVFIGVVLLVTVIHELFHGTGFYLITKKVQYGAKWGSMGLAFYATSKGCKVTRNQFIIIGLLPQVFTVLAFLLAVVSSWPELVTYSLLMAAAFNLGGGCLDIYSCIYCMKYPRTVIIQDSVDGMAIYKPDPKS